MIERTHSIISGIRGRMDFYKGRVQRFPIQIKKIVANNLIFILSFIFVFSLFPIAYLISILSDIQLTTLTQIAGSMGTLFLTLLLAYLYKSLKDVQEEQTNIQERQQNILERRYLPRLIVDEWVVHGDELHFKITNVGDAAALDIGYSIRIDPAGVFLGEALEGHSDVAPGDIVPFRRTDLDSGTHRNVLKPGETGEFEAIARIDIADDEHHRAHMPYSEYEDQIITNIKESDQDEVWRGSTHFRILLAYFTPFSSENVDLPDSISGGGQPYQEAPRWKRLIIKTLLDVNVDTKVRGTFEDLVMADFTGHSNIAETVLPENFDAERREMFKSQNILLTPKDTD